MEDGTLAQKRTPSQTRDGVFCEHMRREAWGPQFGGWV